MPTLRVFLGGSWREEEDDDEFEKKSIGVFCLLLFCSFAYPESPRIMTLRRVLRLPADTISCAFVGEREAAAEREREKEKGRDKRPSRCKRERERERERERARARRRRFCFLSLLSLLAPSSQKKTTRQRASDRCFFSSPWSLSLFPLALSLSLSQRRAWSSTELLVSALRAQQHTRLQCRPRQPWGRRAATATAESTQRRRRPLQRLLAPAPPPPTTPENRAGVRRAPGGRRRSARSTWC